MRRREFVAAGLTGLVARPAWGAAAPGTIVEIDLAGQTYRYDSATGVDLGAYTDPLGQFVQDCIRVNQPELPLSVFIRPDRGTDRLEVVFELGRAWVNDDVPKHLGPYQARIIRGSTTVATVDVPAHYWFSRWRWQSAPRPIRTASAQLMDQWLVPRLSEKLHPVTQLYRNAERYQPMGLAGLSPYMGATGERPEIGLVTEAQAQYLCTGNEAARDTMFAQAEAAGTEPWNLRDEKTGAPIDVFAYPRGTLYARGHGDPFIPRPEKTPVTADHAHQPALAYLPFLLTGDPYYLEQMQFMATFNVLWRPDGYRYRTTQIRGEAWSMRTWAQVAKVTPANVPKWLQPQAYWKKLLGTYLDWYLKTFVASPEAPWAIFRTTSQTWGDGDRTYQPWQDDFLAAVFGWMVLMGFSEWRPVFEWKIGSTIARTNGQSGWPRAECTPYILTLRAGPDAPWAKDWKEAWDLTAEQFKLTAADSDHLELTKLFYYPYTRGALVLAKYLQIPNLAPSLDWVEGELDRVLSARKPFPYKWALI
jgi:hypothetical protein